MGFFGKNAKPKIEEPFNPKIYEGIVDRFALVTDDWNQGYLTFENDSRIYEFFPNRGPEMNLTRPGDRVRLVLPSENKKGFQLFVNFTVREKYPDEFAQ